jgi:hypothetical protein
MGGCEPLPCITQTLRDRTSELTRFRMSLGRRDAVVNAVQRVLRALRSRSDLWSYCGWKRSI